MSLEKLVMDSAKTAAFIDRFLLKTDVKEVIKEEKSRGILIAHCRYQYRFLLHSTLAIRFFLKYDSLFHDHDSPILLFHVPVPVVRILLLDQLLKVSPCSPSNFVPSSGYLSSHKRRGNPQINFFISDKQIPQSTTTPQPSSTAPTTFVNTKFICSTMGDQSAYMPAPGSLPAAKKVGFFRFHHVQTYP